jgi:hypothetical protein
VNWAEIHQNLISSNKFIIEKVSIKALDTRVESLDNLILDVFQ